MPVIGILGTARVARFDFAFPASVQGLRQQGNDVIRSLYRNSAKQIDLFRNAHIRSARDGTSFQAPAVGTSRNRPPAIGERTL